MPEPSGDAYDAIIIGAGIGGLVCGCYLAKAGMKVLICEQHSKPGGYCTSFKRRGFTFDAAAHSFGGYRDGGNMNKIMRELDLCSKITIRRYDPSDVVLSSDHKIAFWTDLEKTVQGMQDAFPDESKNIRAFIDFLTNPRPADFASLRKKSFKVLLDQYLGHPKLKALLSLPLLGNGDLPPSLLSAFSGVKIYTEFLLDGGYYPDGGMQALSDGFADRFKKLGGELLLSRPVRKIRTDGDRASGVVLENKELVRTNCVISACDARQTFLRLLDKKKVPKDFMSKLAAMVPSQSIFVLYLGLDENFRTLPSPGSNVWYLPDYDLENLYASREKRGPHLAKYYMVRVSPDGKTILAFVNAPFKSKRHWVSNKKLLRESFIEHIERTTIRSLSEHIVYKDAATPYTMYRYTRNYKGAAYGWAGLLNQFADPDLKRPRFINNLYMTGHWTTYAQGVPGVAYMGYDTARSILKGKKINE